MLKALGAEGRAVRPGGGGTKPWGPVSRRGRHRDERAEPDRRAQRRRLHRGAGGGRAARRGAGRGSRPRGRCSRSTPRLGEGGAATIGGVMATNDSGPLRHRYGGVRDLVVGNDRGAVRRHAGHVGRAGDQERRRLRPRQAVHRLLRHAGADRAGRRPAPSAGAGDGDRRGRERRPGPARRRGAVALAGEPLEADCLDVAWRDGAGRLLVALLRRRRGRPRRRLRRRGCAPPGSRTAR